MEKPEQAPLPIGVPSYEEWKAGLLDRLSEHFREEFASADFSSRFFGETAGKGLSLFDFLSRRYDVVATNPPYMGSKNMGPVVKRYVESHFSPGKRDLYAAFILRCLELAKPETGRVAMVTQQSWMFLRSFADLRALDEEKLKKAKGFKGILRETSIETLAHLGPGAFGEISGEVVNTVLFTLAKKAPADDHCLIAFRLIGLKSPEEKAMHLRNVNGTIVSRPLQSRFLTIPQTPVCYWLRERFFDLLAGMTLGDAAILAEPSTTGANDRFIRAFWEAPRSKRWMSISRGGGYAKWTGYNLWEMDWEMSGRRIKASEGSYVRNEHLMFREGLTYSESARGSLGIRELKIGETFAKSGPGIFHHVPDLLSLAGILNCRLCSYILRVTARTFMFSVGSLKILPMPINSVTRSTQHVGACLALKRCIVALDPTERSFEGIPVSRNPPKIAWRRLAEDTEAVTTVLHAFEGLSESEVFKAYGVEGEDLQAALDETGTPAGWFPLIYRYDALPSLPGGLAKIPAEVFEFLQTRRRLNPVPQALSDLKQRLRRLYETGPGARTETEEADADTTEDDEEEGDQIAVGARIPIPAETFLEELSLKMEIHPISVYWLLKEGIEQEGWRCLPEEQRLSKDHFTVLILRLLGHRWPKEIEAEEAVPDWADDDGVIPMMEGTEESTLYQRLRARIAANYGDDQVSAQENVFAEVMDKPLQEWVRKDFFRHHISQFKKRPIAWHLSSAKWASRPRQDAAFECLVYYHKTDGDLLPKIKNQYVIPLIKRLETELRGLENASGSLTGEQEARKSLLMERIQELKVFDAVLTDIGASGFGPDVVHPQLRQYAINDAMLCLKARWLKRLCSVIQEGPLTDWRRQVDETGLHAEFSTWIMDAVTHLDYHCAVVGPQPPLEKTLDNDPTSKELAVMICSESEAMLTGAMKYACLVWWKSFHTTVLKPISEKIRDSKKELQVLKERSLDPKVDPKEESEIKRQMNVLKIEINARQKELDSKSGQGQAVRDVIESWRCSEVLAWETWLSQQAMYDQLSGLNGKRPPPYTVAEFIRQESLYQPDINDGVRVNIAPLQKAGLLTADVIAGKDVDKAIADRAAWRDDERRWCREGKLPKPGWWE
jgi:hypothetical protein